MSQLTQKAKTAFIAGNYEQARQLYVCQYEESGDKRSQYLSILAAMCISPLDAFDDIDSMVNISEEYLRNVRNLFNEDAISNSDAAVCFSEIAVFIAELNRLMGERIGQLYSDSIIDGDMLFAAAKTIWDATAYMEEVFEHTSENIVPAPVDTGERGILHRSASIILASLNNAVAQHMFTPSSDQQIWIIDAIEHSPDIVAYGRYTASIDEEPPAVEKERRFANSFSLGSLAHRTVHKQTPNTSTPAPPKNTARGSSFMKSGSAFMKKNPAQLAVSAFDEKVELISKRPVKYIAELNNLNNELEKIVNLLAGENEGISQDEACEIMSHVADALLTLFPHAEERIKIRFMPDGETVFSHAEADGLGSFYTALAIVACKTVIEFIPFIDIFPELRVRVEELSQWCDLACYQTNAQYEKTDRTGTIQSDGQFQRISSNINDILHETLLNADMNFSGHSYIDPERLEQFRNDNQEEFHREEDEPGYWQRLVDEREEEQNRELNHFLDMRKYGDSYPY